MKLSIVMVGWNGGDYLVNSLQSILNHPPYCSFEIIYVDNGSEDDSVNKVRQRFPFVRIIGNERNLGFVKANNQAIRVAKGEYILLLNTDTVVLNAFFDSLLAFMDTTPRAGAASGKCLHPNGEVQWAIGRFPTPWQFFCTLMRRHRIWGWLFRHNLKSVRTDRLQEQDYAYGACCIVRRGVIDLVGLLDEKIFLLAEDLEWGVRMRNGGWKIYYVPQAGLIHHAGTSTTKRDPKSTYAQGIISHRYVMRKYKGLLNRILFDLFVLIDIAGKGLETVAYKIMNRNNRDPVFSRPLDVLEILRKIFPG